MFDQNSRFSSVWPFIFPYSHFPFEMVSPVQFQRKKNHKVEGKNFVFELTSLSETLLVEISFTISELEQKNFLSSKSILESTNKLRQRSYWNFQSSISKFDSTSRLLLLVVGCINDVQQNMSHFITSKKSVMMGRFLSLLSSSIILHLTFFLLPLQRSRTDQKIVIFSSSQFNQHFTNSFCSCIILPKNVCTKN